MPEPPPPLAIVGEMVTVLGRRQGLLSRVYVDSGESAVARDALHKEFERWWAEAVSALQRAYGEAADCVQALTLINPLALLEAPAIGLSEPPELSFTASRHADLWIFAAGQEYRTETIGRYCIVLGIAREGEEQTAVKQAETLDTLKSAG